LQCGAVGSRQAQQAAELLSLLPLLTALSLLLLRLLRGCFFMRLWRRNLQQNIQRWDTKTVKKLDCVLRPCLGNTSHARRGASASACRL
jgi:hypothetical protein